MFTNGQSGPGHDPRRQAVRHRTDALSCPLGDVQDLSSGGLRLRSRKKPAIALGSTGPVQIKGPDGVISVHGQVVRLRRVGLRTWDIGVKFVNLTPGMKAALGSLAEFGFIGVTDKRRRKTMSASMGLPDYYAVLGLTSEASKDDIKSSFRRLAAQYHPDVCCEPDSAQRFMKIQQAYEVLHDDSRRQAYDLRLAG